MWRPLTLAKKRHVYDVRAEAFLGEFETLNVPLDPMCARVFCLAPKPLPAPTIRAPSAAAREVAGHGGTLEFTVGQAGPAPARQLVRITVADGHGRDREELMQTVWVKGEPVGSSLPLALNDPTGAWTLTATERDERPERFGQGGCAMKRPMAAPAGRRLPGRTGSRPARSAPRQSSCAHRSRGIR